MSGGPYGVDDLACRVQPPDQFAYPSHDAYLLGWYTWRALRRDGRLTDAERDAYYAVVVERVMQR